MIRGGLSPCPPALPRLYSRSSSRSAWSERRSSAIIRAGGINVAAGPRAYPHFSREPVVALAPDVMVITTMSRSGAFNKARADWQRLTHIPAVRHHRIHMVDSDVFDRPSPRLVQALEILTQLLHPGLLKDGP